MKKQLCLLNLYRHSYFLVIIPNSKAQQLLSVTPLDIACNLEAAGGCVYFVSFCMWDLGNSGFCYLPLKNQFPMVLREDHIFNKNNKKFFC